MAATYLFINEHPGSLTSPAIWLLGLSLGVIYRYTRSLSAAIACHVVNNCVVLYVLPALTY